MWTFLKQFSARSEPEPGRQTPAAADAGADAPKRLRVLSASEVAQAGAADATARKDPNRPKSLDTLYKKGVRAVANGNNDQAAGHFASVLKMDPAHTEARAEIGRLRFAAPPQPLLDEVRERNPIDLCEVIIEVRNPCNFRCHYCVGYHNDKPVQPFDLDGIRRALSGITAKLVVTSYDCGGGEPTIHPQFPELLRLCAERGPVSFPTNNSQNPERWLPRETAKRIYVRAALHPEAEEKLDRYVRNARYLIEAGCEFSSIFVSHPERMHKIPEYRKFFADMGVPFTPVSFIGEYQGRDYPHAYSEAEQEMLGLNQVDRSWFHKIEPHVTRIRNFRGIPCVAGFRSIFIQADGSVRRCRYDRRVLDAPLTAPAPCGVKNCGCGLFLEKLNIVESLEFYNSWAPKAGLPMHDASWMERRATELGYPSVQDALAHEHGLMYDELMRAFGKDEFPEP